MGGLARCYAPLGDRPTLGAIADSVLPPEATAGSAERRFWRPCRAILDAGWPSFWTLCVVQALAGPPRHRRIWTDR